MRGGEGRGAVTAFTRFDTASKKDVCFSMCCDQPFSLGLTPFCVSRAKQGSEKQKAPQKNLMISIIGCARVWENLPTPHTYSDDLSSPDVMVFASARDGAAYCFSSNRY